MRNQRKYAVCVRNEGYEESLEVSVIGRQQSAQPGIRRITRHLELLVDDVCLDHECADHSDIRVAVVSYEWGAPGQVEATEKVRLTRSVDTFRGLCRLSALAWNPRSGVYRRRGAPRSSSSSSGVAQSWRFRGRSLMCLAMALRLSLR
jgi:hypothetical protein